MSLNDIPKERPVRIYGSGDNLYVFDGGKKKKIVSKKSKSETQKAYFNKLLSRIQPKSEIKLTERTPYLPASFVEKLKALENIRNIPAVEDTDEGLKAKKRTEDDDKQKLDDIKKKIKDGKILTEEEKLLYPLYLEEKASGDLEERKLRDAQSNRDQTIRDIFDEYKINGANFPIRAWNGLRNGNTRTINHYLKWFIDIMMTRTPHQIINIMANAGLNPRLTNEETPPQGWARYTPDDINIPNRIDRAIQHSAMDKRERIITKLLAYLTPRVFNSIISTNRATFLRNRQIPNPEQIGTGKKLPALYNDEIEEFFDDEKEYPHFGGVISSDQIMELPKKLPIGFIMNLDKESEPGSHWVAVYISGDSVEYFDPLANPPTESFKRDIKKYLESMHVPVLMKFKVNRIVQQHGNSHRCGFHAIRFLDDRFHGIPYTYSTRYINNSKEGEEKIKKEFEYI